MAHMQANMEMQRVACPACGNPDSTDVAERTDSLKIVQCSGCGLAYLNPRPSREEIFKLYQRNYYCGAAATAVGYDAYRPTVGMVKWIRPQVWNELTKHIDLRNLRVLDVGCAFGQLVYWMQKAGAKANGIDISPEGIEWGRRKLSLDLHVSSLDDYDAGGELFDVITMIDVIEHLVDLKGFMTKLVSLLKPGGRVFVQTPNFASFSTHRHCWCFLRFSLEHLIYFDTASLDRIFANHGLARLCPSYVLLTDSCDVDRQIAKRTAPQNPLKRLIRRLPLADALRLVRSLVWDVSPEGKVDPTGREGGVLIGCYSKA